MRVLFIWDCAGIGDRIARHINQNNSGQAYVICRKEFNRLGLVDEKTNVVIEGKLRFLFGVIYHLLRFRPNIVHVSSWTKGVLFAKLFSRAKIVFQWHGTDLRELGGRKHPLWLHWGVDQFIYSTKDLPNYFIKVMGYPL